MKTEFNITGTNEALRELSCWGKVTDRWSPTDWNILVSRDDADDFVDSAERLKVEVEFLRETEE